MSFCWQKISGLAFRIDMGLLGNLCFDSIFIFLYHSLIYISLMKFPWWIGCWRCSGCTSLGGAPTWCSNLWSHFWDLLVLVIKFISVIWWKASWWDLWRKKIYIHSCKDLFKFVNPLDWVVKSNTQFHLVGSLI